MIRVDSCLIPPGMIASAKMYSLVLEGDTLYQLFTGPGPASIIDYSRGLLHLRQSKDMLTNAVTTAVVNHYIGPIQANEARINPQSLATMAQEKHSCVYDRSSIGDIVYKEQGAWIKFSFSAKGKKIKFDCSIIYKEELQALAQALAS